MQACGLKTMHAYCTHAVCMQIISKHIIAIYKQLHASIDMHAIGYLIASLQLGQIFTCARIHLITCIWVCNLHAHVCKFS